MPMAMATRLIALAAVAVIAGAGLCLFDADHTASADLCLASLTIASGLLLAIQLVLTGRSIPGFAPAYQNYPPDLPAPPPRV